MVFIPKDTLAKWHCGKEKQDNPRSWRTMLNEAKLPDVYWREEIYTIVYILNRGKLRFNNHKTPHQLWCGRPASVKYFRVFGSKCYIKGNEDDLGKLDSRTNEGIFL